MSRSPRASFDSTSSVEKFSVSRSPSPPPSCISIDQSPDLEQGYPAEATSDSTEPLLQNRVAKRPTFGWRRTIGYLVPLLFLVAVGVAFAERLTISSLTSTLTRVRTSIATALQPATADTPYYCPQASAPRPSSPFLPGDLSDFHTFESNMPEFNISIAYAPAACNQFRVKVTRTDPSICSLARDGRVSASPAEQEYITKIVGPDTFSIRVEGAERFAMSTPTRYSREECSYEYDVRLNTPGTVWLIGFRMFQNYDGFYELHQNAADHLYPALSPLLPRPLELNICSSKCQPFVPRILSSPPSAFAPFALDSPPTPPLPACTGPDPIPGTYVASSLMNTLYPPVPLPMAKTRPSAGIYDFVPTRCQFDHDGLRFRNHLSCIQKPRSVLFTGDSHGRGFYDVLLHRLGGNNSVLELSEKMPTKAAQLGFLHLEFAWDAFMDNPFDCMYMRNFDSIVISSGSHQAGLRCETTSTTAFTSHLAEVFATLPRRLAECRPPGSAPPTLIYVNSPAYFYPLRHHRLDCRTGPRLEYWNRLASELARSNGWSVVDSFAHTKPFAIDTGLTDGTHYFGLDPLDPMADEVIEKLGICGTNSWAVNDRIWGRR